MTTGLLTTTAGQAAIAADLAGGADLVLSHVAFGDSNGVPYAPNEAQVSLVNEKYRSTIASVAVVAGAIVVDAVIPADTPDGSGRPSHGFNIAEAGLYSAAGTLIGVARMGNGYKPPPSSGQAAIATFRFKLPVANPSAISVVIDPQAQLQLGRNVRPFWMTVDGVQNAPPGAPGVGATYVIGAAPTGAWAGFANRLAQWIGVWALASAPEGHLVCDLSKAENDDARFLKRTATGWNSAAATQTAFGFARMATIAEAAAKLSSTTALTPLTAAAATAIAGRQQVFTASGTFTVPDGVTSVYVEVIGGGGGAGSSGDGSGSTVAGNVGAGGGGGGYASKVITGLVPGSTIPVTVGSAGVSAVSNGSTSGGTSSFGAHCSASGGARGSWGVVTASGSGSGGVGSGGDVNLAGGAGGFSGPNSASFSPSDIIRIYGRGGVPPRGFGIVSWGGTGADGIGNGAGGSGGSGGSNTLGGNGSPGLVIVRW